MKYVVVRGLVGVFSSRLVARLAARPGYVVLEVEDSSFAIRSVPTNLYRSQRALRKAPGRARLMEESVS